MSKQATPAEQSIRQQEASFTTLLQSLGEASFEEIEELMIQREEVEPESGLTPEMLRKLQQRIAKKRQRRRPT